MGELSAASRVCEKDPWAENGGIGLEQSLKRLWTEQGDQVAAPFGYDPKLMEYLGKVADAQKVRPDRRRGCCASACAGMNPRLSGACKPVVAGPSRRCILKDASNHLAQSKRDAVERCQGRIAMRAGLQLTQRRLVDAGAL